MRFAYLSCDLGVPVGGRNGPSTHVGETIGALRALGHRVVFASPVLDPAARRQDTIPLPLDGMSGEAVGLLQQDADAPAHLWKECAAMLQAERTRRVLVETLAGDPPDVLYERYSLFGYGGVEAARALGVPHILEVNAPLAHEQAAHRRLALHDTAHALEARIFGAADLVVVVSRALGEHVARAGVAAERIAVVPNGVDARRYDPAVVTGTSLRARLGLENRRVVGFVGSLKPWHDVATLVTAVERLAAGDPRVHLLVAGDGPSAALLDRLPPDQVTRTGAIAQRDVPEALAAMDAVAVPYAADSGTYFSPLKLFEAMAMARPVVGARLGQVAEVVRPGVDGLLYEPGDADALASSLQRVLEDDALAARLGAAARRSVLAGRTWAQVAGRIADLAARVRLLEVAA